MAAISPPLCLSPPGRNRLLDNFLQTLHPAGALCGPSRWGGSNAMDNNCSFPFPDPSIRPPLPFQAFLPLRTLTCPLRLCLLSGSSYYDNVRPLAYPDSDAVLICFDISRPETLDSVLKKVGAWRSRTLDGGGPETKALLQQEPSAGGESVKRSPSRPPFPRNQSSELVGHLAVRGRESRERYPRYSIATLPTSLGVGTPDGLDGRAAPGAHASLWPPPQAPFP